MKKNVIKKVTKTILFFVITTIIFSSSIFLISNNQSKNQNLIAVEETTIDNETPIFRESGFISIKLWDALKSFYNTNKTPTMPDIQSEDGVLYLTIDLFVDFPVSNLNLLNQNIDSIKNLSYFNLDSFSDINLSNNKIKTIENELKQLKNIQTLNLSNNQLTEFSVENLSTESIESLTQIDISKNKIENCNLSSITQAEINATDNNITLQNLILPTDDNITVWLSHNKIIDPNTENTNIHYGFQGVKNNENYPKNTSIEFFGLDDIENIKIYSITENNEVIQETEIGTLYANSEKYSFGIGKYKIKIGGTYEDIVFSVLPDAPTIKMFQNGEEIELTHYITSNVTIKIYGEDGAVFSTFVNSQNISGDTIELTQEGTYQLVFYQYVNGYKSFRTEFLLKFNAPKPMAWVYMIIAFGGFAAVFYIVIKFLPQISKINIGKRKSDKDNLDL